MNKNLKYIKESVAKTFKEFGIGTKKMFKEFFNKDTNKKQRANMWTFSRLIIPIITLILSICAISISSPILFLISGITAGFGAITDYFDGKSSRKYNSSSKYGKLLDQICDKVFAGIIGINLLFLNHNYIFILLGELLIASVNIGYKLKHHDLDITSTQVGRFKEWPLFFTLALGFLSPINSTLLTISNISIILTALMQLATAISYIDSNNKEVKKTKFNKIFNEAIVAEEKNNNEKTLLKNHQKSKLEAYKDLRNVLNEIIKNKNNTDINSINVQKIKKL